jgi:hypothetical protein
MRIARGSRLLALSGSWRVIRSRRRSGPWPPTAATLVTQMYGPAVRRKRFRRSVRCAVLHQCIRPLIGARLLRAIMDISARAISLADRPQWAIRVTRVRTCREDRSSISSDPLADLGGYRSSSIVARWRCSFVRALGPFLRPDLRARARRGAETVKAGRRDCLAAWLCAARPRLDGLEHGARLRLVGVPSHLS